MFVARFRALPSIRRFLLQVSGFAFLSRNFREAPPMSARTVIVTGRASGPHRIGAVHVVRPISGGRGMRPVL